MVFSPDGLRIRPNDIGEDMVVSLKGLPYRAATIDLRVAFRAGAAPSSATVDAGAAGHVTLEL
jgi:hypothetical protein